MLLHIYKTFFALSPKLRVPHFLYSLAGNAAPPDFDQLRRTGCCLPNGAVNPSLPGVFKLGWMAFQKTRFSSAMGYLAHQCSLCSWSHRCLPAKPPAQAFPSVRGRHQCHPVAALLPESPSARIQTTGPRNCRAGTPTRVFARTDPPRTQAPAAVGTETCWHKMSLPLLLSETLKRSRNDLLRGEERREETGGGGERKLSTSSLRRLQYLTY